MARPRKDAGTPPAEETIEAAFWRLYEQRPLEKISVKEVCELAGVNKTTFYYHFQGLQDVLASIEEKSLPREAPDMVADLLTAEDKAAFIAGFLAKMGPRFERYCVLLSSRGDPGFAKRAKEVMAERWCERLGVDYAALAPDARMAIGFSMGGATSVFADHGDGEPFDPDVFADVVLSLVAPLAEKVGLPACGRAVAHGPSAGLGCSRVA